MESTFCNKQIIWAKVKGYPWWPAKICKLPTPESNVFKVQFIAEDTHAYLNPKDVRKYEEYYDECSKKKMRGLAPAIQSADQLHKKWLQSVSKTPTFKVEKRAKVKYSPKKKLIKRPYNRRKRESSSDQSQQEEQSESQKIQINPQVNNEESEQDQESQSFQENQNIQSQKCQIQSQQKIDRNKIDIFQDNLIKIAQKVKQNTYNFNPNDFSGLDTLTSDQLLLGKITNLLKFIISKLQTNENTNVLLHKTQQIQWLNTLRQKLKQKIMNHLYDTSYYDQYIKLIQKNKKSRNEYENKLTGYLRTQYKIKKQLADVFSSRLVAQINNGTVSKYKELLQDIKDKKLDLLSVNNKAAIDRCIQALIPKYM